MNSSGNRSDEIDEDVRTTMGGDFIRFYERLNLPGTASNISVINHQMIEILVAVIVKIQISL